MADEDLRAGDAVELRVTYMGTWAAGFEVVTRLDRGYQVKRCSDGSLLPGPTGVDDIRRDRG